MTVAPPEMLEALETADAGILCVQPQEGELPRAHGHRRRWSSGAGSATRTWSA